MYFIYLGGTVLITELSNEKIKNGMRKSFEEVFCEAVHSQTTKNAADIFGKITSKEAKKDFVNIDIQPTLDQCKVGEWVLLFNFRSPSPKNSYESVTEAVQDHYKNVQGMSIKGALDHGKKIIETASQLSNKGSSGIVISYYPASEYNEDYTVTVLKFGAYEAFLQLALPGKRLYLNQFLISILYKHFESYICETDEMKLAYWDLSPPDEGGRLMLSQNFKNKLDETLRIFEIKDHLFKYLEDKKFSSYYCDCAFEKEEKAKVLHLNQIHWNICFYKLTGMQYRAGMIEVVHVKDTYN